MAKVTYLTTQGERYVIDVDDGTSLMQAAVDNLVPGILGDCGGACACATCHVYVDPAWLERLGKPSELEAEMLAGLLAPRDNSRLCCQIHMDESLDGLVLNVPESQY